MESSTHPLLAPFLRHTNAQGGNDLSFSTNTYNIEAQQGVEFGPINRLTYGLNYRYNTVDGRAVSHRGHENRFGLYVQDEWKIFPSLSAVAGVRYDLHSRIEARWSPRVALIYTLAPEHTFRLSGSVAYRPPTLFENNLDVLFLPTFPPLFAPFPLVGSDTLGPEQIISYDIGYQG